MASKDLGLDRSSFHFRQAKAKTDNEVRELAKRLDLSEVERKFPGWRTSFTKVHEVFLSQMGTHAARQGYKDMQKSIDKLAKTLLKVQLRMDSGGLAENVVTVKGRNSVNEFSRAMTQAVNRLEKCLPTSKAEEEERGYTKYQLGAVLLKDGFRIYELLMLCREIAHFMAQGSLSKVLDRQTLELIDFYEKRVKVFCDVMADLGRKEMLLRDATEHAARYRVRGQQVESDDESMDLLDFHDDDNDSTFEESDSLLDDDQVFHRSKPGQLQAVPEEVEVTPSKKPKQTVLEASPRSLETRGMPSPIPKSVTAGVNVPISPMKSMAKAPTSLKSPAKKLKSPSMNANRLHKTPKKSAAEAKEVSPFSDKSPTSVLSSFPFPCLSPPSLLSPNSKPKHSVGNETDLSKCAVPSKVEAPLVVEGKSKPNTSWKRPSSLGLEPNSVKPVKIVEDDNDGGIRVYAGGNSPGVDAPPEKGIRVLAGDDPPQAQQPDDKQVLANDGTQSMTNTKLDQEKGAPGSGIKVNGSQGSLKKPRAGIKKSLSTNTLSSKTKETKDKSKPRGGIERSFSTSTLSSTAGVKDEGKPRAKIEKPFSGTPLSRIGETEDEEKRAPDHDIRVYGSNGSSTKPRNGMERSFSTNTLSSIKEAKDKSKPRAGIERSFSTNTLSSMKAEKDASNKSVRPSSSGTRKQDGKGEVEPMGDDGIRVFGTDVVHAGNAKEQGPGQVATPPQRSSDDELNKPKKNPFSKLFTRNAEEEKKKAGTQKGKNDLHDSTVENKGGTGKKSKKPIKTPFKLFKKSPEEDPKPNVKKSQNTNEEEKQVQRQREQRQASNIADESGKPKKTPLGFFKRSPEESSEASSLRENGQAIANEDHPNLDRAEGEEMNAASVAGKESEGDDDLLIFYDVQTDSIGKLSRKLCLELALITQLYGENGIPVIPEAETYEPERNRLISLIISSLAAAKESSRQDDGNLATRFANRRNSA